MGKYEYLICGSAGVNKFFMVDELPREGTTVYFDNDEFDKLHFGGPGLNIAYLLGKLGVGVVPMLCETAGKQYQPELEKILTDCGMPLDAMTPPDRDLPHYAVLIQDRHHHHMTICQQFVGTSAAEQNMDEKWFAEIRQAVVCANAPQNIRLFLNRAEKYCNDVIFSVKTDPVMFPDDVVKRLLKLTTILFMNEKEAGHILSVAGAKDIDGLFDNGKLTEVVVTAGERGSTVYTKNGEIRYVAVTPSERCVDGTGVGDAYVAGYLYGKANQLPPGDCARLASTLASFIIEMVGDITNAPTLDELIERNNSRRDLQ